MGWHIRGALQKVVIFMDVFRVHFIFLKVSANI